MNSNLVLKEISLCHTTCWCLVFCFHKSKKERTLIKLMYKSLALLFTARTVWQITLDSLCYIECLHQTKNVVYCSNCDIKHLRIVYVLCTYFHPSIIYTAILYGHMQAGLTLDRLRIYRKDKQQFMLAFTLIGSFEQRADLTCMSQDCGRKPEQPAKTHAGLGRTCKLQSAGRFKPRSFRCQATVLTAALLRCLYKTFKFQESFVFNITIYTVHIISPLQCLKKSNKRLHINNILQ